MIFCVILKEDVLGQIPNAFDLLELIKIIQPNSNKGVCLHIINDDYCKHTPILYYNGFIRDKNKNSLLKRIHIFKKY